MGNQNQNGRNVALPDENRPSWRPQDQTARVRGGDEDLGRSWTDRDDRDDDRRMSDRDRGDRGRFVTSQPESRWDDDRDEGYRPSERYGQGQSGYAAGRYGEDRSMQSFQNRNQTYAGGYEDRQHGGNLDDRFSGRGGQGYWQDRGGIQDRQFQDRQVQDRQLQDRQGYHSGYNQGAMGFGGYGSAEQGMSRSGSLRGQGGFGAQGMGPGHTGGYAPQGGAYGGRSGPYGQGYQGREQPGGGWQDQQQRQRGMHRGKGPQGYQRSDERIREMVCEALTDDDQIDASTIEVAVKNGEVTLSGTVPDRQTKRMAEDVVERCAGVKDVQNQIKVSSDQSSSRGAPSTHVSGKSESETPSSDRKHRA